MQQFHPGKKRSAPRRYRDARGRFTTAPEKRMAYTDNSATDVVDDETPSPWMGWQQLQPQDNPPYPQHQQMMTNAMDEPDNSPMMADIEQDEDDIPLMADIERGEETEPDDEMLSPLERGEGALAELKWLTGQPGANTDNVGAEFERLQASYGMQWIYFNQDDTGDWAVQFKINPEFELKLNGGHAIEMRSEGKGLGSVQTRVRWEPQTLNLTSGSHSGGSYTVGRHMMAMPLSQDHATGTSATAGSDHVGMMGLLPAMGHRRSKGSGNLYYIRGHLLNDNLGGIANEANLYPITHEANGQHKTHVEEYIKKGIDKGYVYRYELDVRQVGNVGYDSSAITGTTTALNRFTVDSDIHFSFARLDSANNDVAGTAHSGKIESRYDTSGAAPFTNTTEYATDYTGGSYNHPVAVGAGSNAEATDTSTQATPLGSNAGLTSDISATGFTYGLPTNPGSWASGGGISASASLIPTSDRLSLRQSTKANVVTYFDSWVPAWTATDIGLWVDDVRTPGMTQWHAVFSNATTAHKLAVGVEAKLRHASALTRVTINGAAVNT